MYLLPQPHSIQPGEGTFTVTCRCRIIVSLSGGRDTLHHAVLLQNELEKSLGYRLALTRGASAEGSIVLDRTAAVDAQDALWAKEGGYRLQIGKEGILIQAVSDEGILYGVQTLRQMVAGEGAVLPVTVIEDYPELLNRGFYHDVTRGRIPTLAYMKKLADRMAYYKLNQLQLYIEHSFLFTRFSEMWRDDTPITPEEILELDEYCRGLHIELVPSLSTFGHLYKLLGTKTWNHLCELDGWQGKEFSFVDRMAHHTVDVSNPDSMKLIKEMIDEFMPLFSSKQFNICGDETFDLGKGKSSALAQQNGSRSLYMNHIKELCEYVIARGKRPMFWGDIICNFPDAVKELPEETICLNWGYSPDEKEESSRKLYEAGAVQYSCPGVIGWDQFINRTLDSYENISRMASYAYKYGSIGLLNTDWGDYGHVNHPDFSIPGMIYGAAFSWNSEIPSFEEINRSISRVEFTDRSEKIMEIIAETTENVGFEWATAVRFMEAGRDGVEPEIPQEWLQRFMEGRCAERNAALDSIRNRLYALLPSMEIPHRARIMPYVTAVEGIMIFNRIGDVVRERYFGQQDRAKDTLCRADAFALAGELETWFMHYKEVWRSVSREAELYRIQNVINWYADYLRE